MDEDIKASLTAGETWIRGLFMLLFAAIYWVAEMVLVAVAVVQFIFLLVTRDPNERLQDFGDDLSIYFYQIIQFLTFNTEEKPFPFRPWPSGEVIGPGGEEAAGNLRAADDAASESEDDPNHQPQ